MLTTFIENCKTVHLVYLLTVNMLLFCKQLTNFFLVSAVFDFYYSQHYNLFHMCLSLFLYLRLFIFFSNITFFRFSTNHLRKLTFVYVLSKRSFFICYFTHNHFNFLCILNLIRFNYISSYNLILTRSKLGVYLKLFY